MTVIRVQSPSQLPKEHGLKPIDRACLKDLLNLHRDRTKTVYFYRRRFSRFPPLLFQEQPAKVEPADQAPVQLSFV